MIAIIIFVILVLGTVALMQKGLAVDNMYIFSIGIIVLLLSPVAIALVLYDRDTKKEPKAIDVYRGRTTLEITYRDSIPVDSTVILKNK